jgi:UDP-2,3-diacylglucosamine pyrophosphatase LpxH
MLSTAMSLAVPQELTQLLVDDRQPFAQRRLTDAYERAQEVPFDDSSRIVLFSDCHRGDRSRADAFAQNESVFFQALKHYYRSGFTYIEVGDGDELWQNRQASVVVRAHRRIFDLLHSFDIFNRLHLILGNHDVQASSDDVIDKDGLLAKEGLILSHVNTGKSLFVVHGHQVDSYSDHLSVVGRFMARSWRRLQALGVRGDAVWSDTSRKWKMMRKGVSGYQHSRTRRIERSITHWIRMNRQTVICGHTHKAAFATGGASPYFNTGSCVRPGGITGLEISDGKIQMVKWVGGPGSGHSPLRQLLSPSVALTSLN